MKKMNKKGLQSSVELIIMSLIIVSIFIGSYMVKEKQDKENDRNFKIESLQKEGIKIAEKLLTPKNEELQNLSTNNKAIKNDLTETKSSTTLIINNDTITTSTINGELITRCLQNYEGAIIGVKKEKTTENLNGQTIRYYIDKCDNNWNEFSTTRTNITNTRKFRIKVAMTTNGVNKPTLNKDVLIRYYFNTTMFYNEYLSLQTTTPIEFFKEKNKIQITEFNQLKLLNYTNFKTIIGTNHDVYLRIRDEQNAILNEYGKSCEQNECYIYKRLIYYDNEKAYLEIGIN